MITRPPLPDDEGQMLAAEYVLGLLPQEERADFKRRLVAEPALAAVVRQWEEQFAGFADEIAPVVPPLTVKAGIEERLFKVEKTTLWSSVAFWRGLAVASVLGVVALGSWTMVQESAPQSVLVADVAGETNALKIAAFYDAATGELRLNRTQGEAVAGRSLELWLIAGQDVISLGVLPDTTPSRHTIPADLRAKFAGAVLAVTDEPAGGSPTGKATGPIVAKGALTSI
jgi:anti-sigma-K factor RskA